LYFETEGVKGFAYTMTEVRNRESYRVAAMVCVSNS